MLLTTQTPVLRLCTGRIPPWRVSRVVGHANLARLLSSLAVLEQREGKLNVSSLSSITAAQKLGGPVTGIVAGSNIRAVAEEVAKVKGLDKVIAIENGAYDKVGDVNILFAFECIAKSLKGPPRKLRTSHR